MKALSGNTFPVKEQLKALGARWNKEDHAWEIDDDKAEAAQAIIDKQPPRPKPETKICWECGCSFTYAECRRNDGDWADSYCGC